MLLLTYKRDAGEFGEAKVSPFGHIIAFHIRDNGTRCADVIRYGIKQGGGGSPFGLVTVVPFSVSFVN